MAERSRESASVKSRNRNRKLNSSKEPPDALFYLSLSLFRCSLFLAIFITSLTPSPSPTSSLSVCLSFSLSGLPAVLSEYLPVIILVITHLLSAH